MTTSRRTRREVLSGALAAASLAACRSGGSSRSIAALADPLAPRPPHHPARARNLIFVFLPGGMSHLESFDPKPQLFADDGKDLGGGKKLLKPRWEFQPAPATGIEVSDLFPHLRERTEDMCIVRSMVADHGNHVQAVRSMHTGSTAVVRPSLGAWISYGLGSGNRSLPSFAVLAPHLPYAGEQVWGADFLPACHQGVRIIPGEHPLKNLELRVPPERAARELSLLRRLNDRAAAARSEDDRLAAQTSSFELAEGLRRTAPEVFDLGREDDATHELYGLKRGATEGFAWQCLVARRLIERDVRVVELIDVGASNNWDSHGNMNAHGKHAGQIDRPLAGLLVDLRRRGMLKETLVVCATEFGRTPHADKKNPLGRGHHRQAFSMWLAGGGIRGGHVHGETDEHGSEVVADAVGIHDLHATMLALMGLDHERLTFRHASRDFRLTDVGGRVVDGLLA